MLDNYTPKHWKQSRADRSDLITKLVNQSKTVDRLAKALANARAKADPPNDPQWLWENILAHVRSTTVGHFGVILHARTTTLSKRYAVTEALFQTYKLGLLPFGWDWNSIWCLDPAPLLSGSV
jgi:hypothetical protein